MVSLLLLDESTADFQLPFQDMQASPLRRMNDLQESRCKMDAIKLSPESLAEMVKLIENGTISGKIGKQILPKLLQVRFRHNCLLF